MADVIKYQDLSGSFPGGTYLIQHRDTNSILILNLDSPNRNCINAKPGTMVSITSQVTIDGSFQFSFKAVFSGDQVAFLHVGGVGQATMSNHSLGDIIALQIQPGQAPWTVNRTAFMAMTEGVTRESKSQSIGKTFGSGSGLWVHHYIGQGMLWLESFGAILTKDLAPGESFLVHSHYAVAWCCSYNVETIKTTSGGGFGGFLSKLASGEFWMLKFTGPGRVYMSSKSLQAFAETLIPYMPAQRSS